MGKTNGQDILISSYDKGKARFTDDRGMDVKIIDELERDSGNLKNIDLVIFDEV